MRAILGIDLAAQPAATGVVRLSVHDDRWHAEEPAGPADDERLVGLANEVDVIGIDAPLGWPSDFVEAVHGHHSGRCWDGTSDRSRLTHRDTDRAVRSLTGRLPLSASADKLGVCAMRCALLQTRWAEDVWGEPAPRDGSGPLVETYPAAALRAWGLPFKEYKGPTAEKAGTARGVRASIVGEIATRVR